MLEVLVVDDMFIYQKIITKAVEATGLAKVKHTASNGLLALERLAHGSYDVVLMDIVMPEMDGLTALEEMKKLYPDLPVIMISSNDYSNASFTINALKKGALDFIVKPEGGNPEQNLNFLKNFLSSLFVGIRMNKVTAKKDIRSEDKKTKTEKTSLKGPGSLLTAPNELKPCKIRDVDFVLIASSTGGPVALETVLGGVSDKFRKPVIVVQHLPAKFTKVLAETLNKKTILEVVEGEEGMKARAGQVIIAPGGLHTLTEKKIGHFLSLKLEDSEPVNGVKPSADVFFKSFASEFKGSRVLVVILTGMGSDGKAGVAAIKEHCQCYCITQNEKTSVVYGMPKSVREAGLANEELPLDAIAFRAEHISLYGS